ncbi:MAG: ATP-dependent Clp protease proteolytic subunit [Alphaproteobacteria bacterium]|nr:ATP-dependent Clp protease proteolytic subunit [Alphaproteobacteria bacterium]
MPDPGRAGLLWCEKSAPDGRRSVRTRQFTSAQCSRPGAEWLGPNPRSFAVFRLDDEDEKSDEKTPATPPLPPVAQALYKSRTVLIFGEVDMKMAERVTAQLLALASEGSDPIRVVLNSPGGHVESGDTIHDVIRFCGPIVKIIGTGWVASAGAHIFLGAKRENRLCLPFTRFLLHQPLGGVRGQASDISIEAEEILKMRERLNHEIARETGQTFEKVVADTERNFWMSAEEAVAYGLVGRIVSRADEV